MVVVLCECFCCAWWSFFFFKQKTAYELRISDWSSDVCSSDLGLMLDPPGPHRVVPQWQKSKGCMIMTAALELSGNQVTHFYSDRKNTTEMIRMMDALLDRYADRRTLYLSWDAASWHVSKKLKQRITEHNATAEALGLPRVETAPLPSGDRKSTRLNSSH